MDSVPVTFYTEQTDTRALIAFFALALVLIVLGYFALRGAPRGDRGPRTMLAFASLSLAAIICIGGFVISLRDDGSDAESASKAFGVTLTEEQNEKVAEVAIGRRDAFTFTDDGKTYTFYLTGKRVYLNLAKAAS